MRIIPAVDVLGGSAVRLTKGDYDSVTVYSDDPGGVVAGWAGHGVSLVHVVDLEAARTGRRQRGILDTLAGCGASVQLGGGIRTALDAKQVVDADAQGIGKGAEHVAGNAQCAVLDPGQVALVHAHKLREFLLA